MAREHSPLPPDVRNLLNTRPEVFTARLRATDEAQSTERPVAVPMPRESDESMSAPETDTKPTLRERFNRQIGRLTLGTANTERQEG